MTRKTLLATGLSLLCCVGAPNLTAAPKSHPNTAGWQSLIAPDFSNADQKPGDWAFEGGMLVAKDVTTIWTKKSYGNFVLDLEFKVAKKSNSGVFLRSGDIKNTLAALEIQVHDSTDGALYGMVGAIYNAQPPAKNMSKPIGEWNRFTITCNGGRVSLIFNGEEVFDADLDTWTTPMKNPDGTANKFPKALKDFSRNGPIGLEGRHGKIVKLEKENDNWSNSNGITQIKASLHNEPPVWYRNIKIREIE